MSGPKDGTTSGDVITGDASSRRGVVSDQPIDLKASFLPRYSESESLADLSSSRAAYQNWISILSSRLSEHGQNLLRADPLKQLQSVPHSTVAHSRLMNHVDLSRWDHCIHAAYTARTLASTGQLGLNPYEVQVLELVMLLHDPHRLGSHALDRVFASMPGAPKDFNSWWPADDYHEYHGALLNSRDQGVRWALGKYCDDVFSILTLHDQRSQKERLEDYGPLNPRLNSGQLSALYRLKDELDRCSYLKLDYLRSGFNLHIIEKAFRDVSRHEQTLRARGAGIQISIDERSGPEPYNDVARLRSMYREKLATLPLGCLVERAIFHEGVWNGAQGVASDYPESFDLYKHVRWCAFRGFYEDILSKEAQALLEAAKTGQGMSVEDRYAPLVTMTLADMSEGPGFRSLEECLPWQTAKRWHRIPRRDMTVLESKIRSQLVAARLDCNVHVLTSNDFSKTFEYEVSRRGSVPVREVARNDCHDSLIKVVIAAKAVTSDGRPIDLSQTRAVVTSFLRESGYLKDPNVLNKYNPRVFCDPPDLSVFRPDIRQKIASFTPRWMELGGCGLFLMPS